MALILFRRYTVSRDFIYLALDARFSRLWGTDFMLD
jgi:hypothetical protein